MSDCNCDVIRQGRRKKNTGQSPAAKRRKLSKGKPVNRSLTPGTTFTRGRKQPLRVFRTVNSYSPPRRLQRRVEIEEDIEDSVLSNNRLSRPRHRVVVGRLRSMSQTCDRNIDSTYNTFTSPTARQNRAFNANQPPRKGRPPFYKTRVEYTRLKDSVDQGVNRCPTVPRVGRFAPNIPIKLKTISTQTLFRKRPTIFPRTKLLKEKSTSISNRTFHSTVEMPDSSEAISVISPNRRNRKHKNGPASDIELRSCLRSRSGRRPNSKVSFNESVMTMSMYPDTDESKGEDGNWREGRGIQRNGARRNINKKGRLNVYPNFKKSNKLKPVASIHGNKKTALIPRLMSESHACMSTASSPTTYSSWSSDGDSSSISYVVTVRSKDGRTEGKYTQHSTNLKRKQKTVGKRDKEKVKKDNNKTGTGSGEEGQSKNLQNGADNSGEGDKDKTASPTYIG